MLDDSQRHSAFEFLSHTNLGIKHGGIWPSSHAWAEKAEKCDSFEFLFGKSPITYLAQPNVTNIQSQKLKPFQVPPPDPHLASHAKSKIQGHLWQEWTGKNRPSHNFGRSPIWGWWRCPWILVFSCWQVDVINYIPVCSDNSELDGKVV